MIDYNKAYSSAVILFFILKQLKLSYFMTHVDMILKYANWFVPIAVIYICCYYIKRKDIINYWCKFFGLEEKW